MHKYMHNPFKADKQHHSHLFPAWQTNKTMHSCWLVVWTASCLSTAAPRLNTWGWKRFHRKSNHRKETVVKSHLLLLPGTSFPFSWDKHSLSCLLKTVPFDEFVSDILICTDHTLLPFVSPNGDRQTDRQTDRQRQRQRHTQREREHVCYIHVYAC